MLFEFRAFELAVRECLHPTEAGGLPEGWQVCWHAIYPPALAETDGTDLEVFVVRRLKGGWGVMFHEANGRGAKETTLWEPVASTLRELYTAACAAAKNGPGSVGMEREVRDFIASRYDLTDPVEAAEATLVGLGAPVTVMPRSLSA